MSRRLASTWIAFAKTGNPNNDQIPQWPAYDTKDRKTMVFDTDLRVETIPGGPFDPCGFDGGRAGLAVSCAALATPRRWLTDPHRRVVLSLRRAGIARRSRGASGRMITAEWGSVPPGFGGLNAPRPGPGVGPACPWPPRKTASVVG
jgi:hypothetical protein